MRNINEQMLEQVRMGQPVYVYHDGGLRKIIIRSKRTYANPHRLTITYRYDLDKKKSTIGEIQTEFKEYLDKINRKIAREVKK